MLIPAGRGVQLDGVHSLHDGLGSGDRDLSLIIRFVLLRIQTSLESEPLDHADDTGTAAVTADLSLPELAPGDTEELL